MSKNNDEKQPKQLTQPIQPLSLDEHGTLRFKKNAIVEYILDEGGIDLNQIGMKDFTREDRVQFAQLIGYSMGGFADLGYVSDEDYEAAKSMHENKLDEKDARMQSLETKLKNVRNGIQEGVAELFGIHPNDLTE